MATIATPGFYAPADWDWPVSTTVMIPGRQSDAPNVLLSSLPPGPAINIKPLNNAFWRGIWAQFLPDAVAIKPGALQLNGSFGRRRARRFNSPTVT